MMERTPKYSDWLRYNLKSDNTKMRFLSIMEIIFSHTVELGLVVSVVEVAAWFG